VTRPYYGWVITGCAFAVLFLTYGIQYSFGVFVPAMVADLGWPRATLGAAFSLYGLVYMVVTIVSGRLTDTLGPRIVITAGGVLLGIGIMTTSLVSSQWQLFVAYGIVAALGMSTAYIPCNMAVVRWFRRKRGLAVGIASSGASCGILIMPLLVYTIIERSDWRTAMFACGAGLLVLTLLAASFFVKEPAHLGLQVDGLAAPEPGDTADADVEPEHLDYSWTLPEARRTLSFWLFVASFAVALITMTVPFVHLPVFASDLKLSSVDGATSVSVIGLFALIGGVSLGALADRIGHRLALVIGLTAQIAAYVAFYFASGMAMLVLGAAFFGTFYGSFVALFPALVAELFGLRHAGTIGGFIVGGGGLLGAWGPAAAGYFRDTGGDYRLAFALSAGVAIAALLMFATLPRPRQRVRVPT